KGRTNRIVASGTLLLDSAKRLFVAGINRGRSAAGQENRQSMGEMPFVDKPAGDPGDVVVADEGLRHKGVEQGIVPVQGTGEVKEISIVQCTPDRLPEFILRDRVD